MCALITSIRKTVNRSLKIPKNRVRCLSVQNFRDSDEIELEMEHHSLIIIFFKEFRIKRPMDGKRFLQRINALIRQYDYEILNLGKLDYFLLLPEEYRITTEALILAK